MRPEKEVSEMLTIQNSKFIGILIPVENEIKKELLRIKETYPKATHYCYAYRMGKEMGMHDDGEPNKTAGLPILKMLEKYNLEMSLLIVIRYFGGIKLGTGGLIRAYQQTAEKTIQAATLLPIKEGYHVTLEVPYPNIEQVDFLLKDALILSKVFSETILIEAKITKEKKEILAKLATILSCDECSF